MCYIRLNSFWGYYWQTKEEFWLVTNFLQFCFISRIADNASEHQISIFCDNLLFQPPCLCWLWDHSWLRLRHALVRSQIFGSDHSSASATWGNFCKVFSFIWEDGNKWWSYGQDHHWKALAVLSVFIKETFLWFIEILEDIIFKINWYKFYKIAIPSLEVIWLYDLYIYDFIWILIDIYEFINDLKTTKFLYEFFCFLNVN